MIILVAMLAADGVSELHSVAPINRGYENIFNRLNAIGANIEVID
jgi:UDP-N-acetylglucosamine 1-carboxyvinyltransferase